MPEAEKGDRQEQMAHGSRREAKLTGTECDGRDAERKINRRPGRHKRVFLTRKTKRRETMTARLRALRN